MSYSVSSCMILQWAYQSLYLIVREFHAFYLKEKGMARLRVLIAMTLDGSIPAEDDPLRQWLRDDKDGFSYGRGKSTRRLYPGYPLVDFMCEKDMSDPSILYQAEIHDEESIELLRGLSVYHLIDEMIIFLFPSTRPNHKSVSKHLPRGEWKTVKSKTFKNGICRLVYCKTLQ